jgi:hypothetical protein
MYADTNATSLCFLNQVFKTQGTYNLTLSMKDPQLGKTNLI